eukprot:TRINITY_DN240_c2_g1_i4.p3 TRINITY_DN240_c2_g1~~TRINITY_DN240_c2_g1_i4.p3  ORF type:complete len:247 (+),score=0.02 TRINITY_DN240_c2_g1_i4:280-1020(+)
MYIKFIFIFSIAIYVYQSQQTQQQSSPSIKILQKKPPQNSFFTYKMYTQNFLLFHLRQSHNFHTLKIRIISISMFISIILLKHTNKKIIIVSDQQYQKQNFFTKKKAKAVQIYTAQILLITLFQLKKLHMYQYSTKQAINPHRFFFFFSLHPSNFQSTSQSPLCITKYCYIIKVNNFNYLLLFVVIFLYVQWHIKPFNRKIFVRYEKSFENRLKKDCLGRFFCFSRVNFFICKIFERNKCLLRKNF